MWKILFNFLTAYLYSVCYKKHGISRKIMANDYGKKKKLTSNKIYDKMLWRSMSQKKIVILRWKVNSP